MNKFILPILLSLVALIGFAQEESVNEFSLNDAVNYGLSNNTNYLNVQLDGEIQRERAFEVMTEGFPQISAKLDYGFNFEQQVNIIPAGSFGPAQTEAVEAIFQQPQNATLQAELQQLIFDARYIYGLKAVQGFYEIADAQTELGRINAVDEITKAYYTAAVAQDAYSKLATNEAVLQELLRETTITYQEGLIDELSVNRLELNLANLQTQIAKSKQQSENALLNLKFAIGMPKGENLKITDDLNSLFTGIDAAENANANPEGRIENKILNAQYNLQLYDVKQARSNYFPSLYAYARYGTLAQRENFSFFNSNEQWFDFGVVGFTLNIPIFDGLKAKSQVQQRKLGREQVANNLEQFNRSVELEVAVNVNNLQNAINEFNTQNDNVALAQKILDKTIIMFNEGVGSSFELSTAQTDLTTSQINYTQSVYNLLVAQFELKKSLGKI